jgi:hypothetical protein
VAVADSDIESAFMRSGLEGRRIGRRTPAGGLTIEWHPVDVVDKPRWGLRRVKVARETTAELLDLSLSGAKVAVDEADPVPVGTRVRIALERDEGTAVVRRVEPGPGGRSIYGIHFLHLAPPLQARFTKLLEGDRGYLASRWKSAW